MSKIYVVPTPIGNLKDMTNRAIEVLKDSDIILAEDTRHSQNLMNVFDIKSKLISYHKFNEKKRTEEIIQEIVDEDKLVSIITDAGTPCISDPGYEIIKCARENNIEVIGLAGASAVTIALSVSGINTDEFAFYGFLPRKDKELSHELENIKQNKIKTFVLYESPKRVKNLLKTIAKVMPNADLCLCKELTKLHEKTIYGKVNDLIDKLDEDSNSEKGEYAIVGYNNDYVEQDEKGYNVCLEALIFDKLYSKECTLKGAVKELVEEEISNKNDAYKASLNVKKFLESNVFTK